jgi:hypothetical protein
MMQVVMVAGADVLTGDRLADKSGQFNFIYGIEPLALHSGEPAGARVAKLDFRAAYILYDRTNYTVLREV